MMVLSTHVATENITRARYMATNFWRSQTGGGEAAPGADLTESAAIEYPINGGPSACTRVKFSASDDGTVPNGSTLLSDYSATVGTTIPRGASYRWRRFLRCPAGMIYYTPYPGKIATDFFKVAVSGLTDQTMTGDDIVGGSAGMNFPLGIIGSTTRPSVGAPGDSVGFGLAGNPNTFGDMGTVCPSLGPVPIAYSNLSCPGESVSGFLANCIQRRKIFAYISHLINELGLVDIGVDMVTIAQLQALLTSLYALVPANVLVFQTTMTPGVTTDDACLTLAGQHLTVIEPVRTGFNDQLRAGWRGPNNGYFELANVIETSLNSGFWKVTPQRWSDGPTTCAHLNPYSYAQLVTQGAIDTSRIVMP